MRMRMRMMMRMMMMMRYNKIIYTMHESLCMVHSTCILPMVHYVSHVNCDVVWCIFMMLDIMTILIPPVLFKHGHGFLWNFLSSMDEASTTSIILPHPHTSPTYFQDFLPTIPLILTNLWCTGKKPMVGISPHLNWSYHLHQSTSTTDSRIRKITPQIQWFTAPWSGWWLSPTPLKNDRVRQLGWWHSQLDGNIIKPCSKPSTSH